MIVTKGTSASASPKLSTLSRGGKYGWTSTAYHGFKTVAKSYGFYKDIKPYLPEQYDRYRYKPRKRLAGYAGQKLWSKKPRYASGYKQYKKHSEFECWHNKYPNSVSNCESS